ncbi:hypothetical protein [Xenorhabdus sp. KJ12.1]|uniref:hypothetical protein n=1 Tax=Xenorhabdus sp. KJ12.1 TaxID=1851571 RepID=UPI000C05313D|nr:hypothetical protein [Xenorhabdus sp. KJ12.1]PHM71725.1 hypothetical protein Xekj_00960 [Xenorhabdus sp. KJ12.1]
MFSKGWLKREVLSWLKGVYSYVIWTFTPALCVFIWSLFMYVVFPNHWGGLSLIGIIVVLLFAAYFAFKSKPN